MKKVSDAGRAWEDASAALDDAIANGSMRDQTVARENLRKAFEAFQEALSEQLPELDDADDKLYRRKAAGAD